ncbi:hypothetical protein Rhopal_003984-T1 [Rhodotorula paludigena]|uniref:Proteophosphoglycan ppg4 n=1 Tax=Rhodotorula paludigena TaxID=86838 RepID=A0AAV5GM69_9BASI|nr:hypothetical protein Rhopal_003984-T1 [Rhodotorula paludigena]
MGHAQSHQYSSPRTGGRSKGNKSPFSSPVLDSAKSASAWTGATSRFRSRSLSRRSRSKQQRVEERRRDEVNRFLYEALEQQREAEETLAAGRSHDGRAAHARLVIDENAAGLTGLRIDVRPPSKPDVAASTRSPTPGMSTSSSLTHSSPALTHSSPGLTSHWSESSASPQSPAQAFQSFRNSLSRAQLNRLSLLLGKTGDTIDIQGALDDAAKDFLEEHEAAEARKRRPPKPRAKGPIVVVGAEPIVWHRFSTTPATLEDIYGVYADESEDERQQAPKSPDNQRRRPSAQVDLSGYIAASPRLAFPVTGENHVAPGSPAAPPVRAPSRARLPPGHPGNHHARFARRPLSPLTRRSSSSSAQSSRRTNGSSPTDSTAAPPFYRRRSSCTPSSYPARLGSVAEGSALSSPGNEVPLCITPGVLPGVPSEERPFTFFSCASGTSFPHSVAHEDESSMMGSPVEARSTRASSSAAGPDLELPSPDARVAHGVPPVPSLSTVDFGDYSMAPSSSDRSSPVDSEIPPDALDAFPAPPAQPCLSRPRTPAPLRFPPHLRHSHGTDASSARSLLDSPPPSSTSFTTTTSVESVELASHEAACVHAVDFTFPSSLGNGKGGRKAKRSPTMSSCSDSLATFVLEDLIDSLADAHGAPFSPVVTPIVVASHDDDEPSRRTERLRSLEAPSPNLLAPPPPLPSLAPRSPPTFAPSFSLNPPFHGGKADQHVGAVSPRSHAYAHDHDRDGDSGRFVVPAAAVDASYRFPPPPSPIRRATDPLPPPSPPAVPAKQPSLRSGSLTSVDARLGCRGKRGLSRDEIGEWLGRARRESEEACENGGDEREREGDEWC